MFFSHFQKRNKYFSESLLIFALIYIIMIPVITKILKKGGQSCETSFIKEITKHNWWKKVERMAMFYY